MATSWDVIVVGAGHNGLVTAALLAKAGRSVLLLERRDIVGGAAVTEELFDGFRVDTGSSRIGGMASDLIGELELEALGVEIVDADPSVFAPSPNGESLLLWADAERTAGEIRAFSPKDADRWVPFTRLLRNAAAVVESSWRLTPPDVTGSELADLWGAARLGRQLKGLGKRDMVEVLRILPMSLYELVDEWFESDLVRGTLAAGSVAGLMQGPMGGGTAHMLLHHTVGSSSVRPMRRIRGGLGVLTEALASRCRALGAEVRTGAGVDRVLTDGGAVTGVVLEGGEEVQSDCVVSGLDPRATFFGLLEPDVLGADFSRKVENIRFRGAVARVHLALSGLPDFTARPGAEHLSGAVSIAPSLEYVERAYDAAKYGRVSERPILDVVFPSVSDPSVAPEGRHLASITMQYAPFDRSDAEWSDEERDRLGALVVSTLEEYTPGVTSLVEERHVMTPADLAGHFALTEGNIYHGEMTLDQLLFMRPVPGASRYRTPVRGLWLCGSGAHPGGGVTGAPGRNAAREILAG